MTEPQHHPHLPHIGNGHHDGEVHHHRKLSDRLEARGEADGSHSPPSSRSSSSDDGVPATGADDTAKQNSNATGSDKQSLGYDIKLTCRSSDPASDSQTLSPDELPEHWVPTMVSQLNRATSSAFGQLTSGASSPRRNSTADRGGKDEQERESSEHHVLPRLTFCNPWSKSFRKPGVKELLNGGLKWGLPDSYTEGSGRGSVRASGFKSQKKAQRQLQLAKQQDEELGEGWDDVGVVQPHWGWPLSALQNEVKDIRHTNTSGGDVTGPSDGGEADFRAKERAVNEWCDPTDPSRPAARVTWLGHASTLLQLPPLGGPSPGEGREDVSGRSLNILFDPIFSERCSPSQSAGPQRFTPAPCRVSDLPPIDIVVISHSHYDHLDYHTFRELRHVRGDRIHAIVPLGVKDKLTGAGGFGWHKDQVSELDWWDHATLTSTGTGSAKVMCTPAQHGSGRGAGDKDASLWASWVVEWNNDGGRFAAFFAGDTGLKFHHDSPEKRHKYPACPAFGEIARRCGPFDLLLLPISVGSSLSYFRSWDPFPRAMSPFPRVSGTLTSSIHMDPYDAVECHTIFKAEEKKASKVVSLAVHYGTFVRNEEQTRADVRELRQACSKQRLRFARVRDETALLHSQSKDDVFIVADQGKTIWLPIHTS
jgi:L-ascorbate metabolism protein UlaG (beta-lactamase superfamily)